MKCLELSRGEAFGYAWDGVARGMTIVSAIFMQIALLEVAERKAVNEELDVLGLAFKPSSLLTLLATFSGLVTALMMPIIGAIVDHTSLRWAIGAGGALMLIVFQIIYLSLGGDTLWLCAIISIFGNFCFYTHYLALLSYLPELFDDEKDTTFINFYTNVLNFSSQIISIVGVIILTAFLGYVKDCEGQGEGEGEEVALVVNTTKNCTEGVLEAEMYDNALGSHRVAQMWSIVFGGTMFAIVWGNYMQHRPPLHPESTGAGGSLVTKGYRKLAKTYQLFQGKFHACRIFLATVALSEAAAIAFVSIAVTYAKEELGLSPGDTSSLLGLVIFMTVPGSVIAGKITNKIGFLASHKYALLFWFAVTILAAMVVNRDTKSLVYYFGMGWGMGFGWIFPIQRNVWFNIVPAGYESEMTGVYLFAGQIITWFPPLVFSVLNQANIPMVYGLVMLASFFLIAFLVVQFSFAKHYDAVVEESKKTLDRRIMSTTSKAVLTSSTQVAPAEEDV